MAFTARIFLFPDVLLKMWCFGRRLQPGQKPAEPIITIRKFTIESTFSGLLSKPGRIRRIIADGLRIQVPEGGANLHGQEGSGQRSDDY